MPDARRVPSDAEYRQAIHDIRVAYLQARFVADRMLWAATSAVLDADTTNLVLRDALVNRDGG